MATDTVQKTQYDSFAQNYASMVDLPGEKMAFNFLRTSLGDVRGLNILDLAGGSGQFAHLFIEMGASHVTVVDVSKEMTKIGEVAEEAAKRTGMIDFRTADCSKPLDHLGPGFGEGGFDMVTGVWFFNYAASREELAGMWRNVASNLKTGGRFVGMMSPFDREECLNGSRKYGIKTVFTGKVADGEKMHHEFDSNPKVEFDVYLLKRELYEGVPGEVGMRDFKSQPMTIEHLPDEFERKDWEDVMKIPYTMVITATK